MSIQSIAAEIAARIPEMAKDCPTNNAGVIQGMLEGEAAEYSLKIQETAGAVFVLLGLVRAANKVVEARTDGDRYRAINRLAELLEENR